ncbi:MAG: energy transducer TonB [Campylobacterota bacterium]|nr:energy transducer TonB [Campylobacterota bacterium]
MKKPIEPEEKKIKISLKEMPKKYKKSGDIKKKVEPSPIAPPMPKGSQLKKITKQPPVKFEPKKPVKKPKLNPKPKPKKSKPQPKPQPKIEPLPPKKPYIDLMDINLTQKPIKNIKEIEDPLYAMLSQDKSPQESERKTKKQVSRLGAGGTKKELKNLYGNEWGKLTAGAQKYMLDNREVMRRITQQILTRVARVNLKQDLNINRSNVIEFYLHPNGDMTDFRFLEKSGYYILDDTTKETISYAYSRYPRPDEKILVRYNVFYNLARY